MKKYLINWLLESIFEMIVSALSALSKKSDNNLDDLIVGGMIANKEKIIAEVKANL